MKLHCRYFFLPLVLATSLAAAGRAESPESPEAPKPPKQFDLAAIDAYVAAQVQHQGYVGLSLAILRDGKIIFAKGYGKRSLEPPAPVETDTSFAIGSITKQFTCACILLLAEEGKLSVRDPVAKYFPLLSRAKDVTLYDLMTHVSGYADYYPLDFVDRRMLQPITPDQLIKEYAGGKLDFDPRTRWSYSNTGYTILGRVVEKVSKEPLGTFLQRRILKRLNMEHSFFEPAADVPGLAKGYTSFALGPPEPATLEAGGWIYAAGGLYTSASDLARWDLALADGKVLNSESYRLMTTPTPMASGKVADYGCGLAISRRDGELVLRHSGAVSGFLAFNALVPRTQSAVVLLANAEHGNPGAVHSTLLNLLLKDQADNDGPAVPKVKGPAPEEVTRDFLHQMQAGTVDRAKLGEEFSHYLTQERIRAAAGRLKALGEPEKVEVVGVAERGGMEVARIRLTFKSAVVGGALYRTPDGKVQQLLFHKE
jgi:CubicO group peptidase (beta-lactamase class C family)